MHSLYGSETRGPVDDSVESKHVALISHYMFIITTVVFDRPSPPFSDQYPLDLNILTFPKGNNFIFLR